MTRGVLDLSGEIQHRRRNRAVGLLGGGGHVAPGVDLLRPGVLLIEIVPDKAFTFFDYKAKYTPGATEEICPARIEPGLSVQAQSYALAAHQALCCRGYSRTDMILVERDIFVLETNTIPGMTATSLYPQAAAAAGLPFGPLLDRLIELALEDHQHRNQT